jgi:integrase
MLIDTLTAILDEAVEDRLITVNPAHSRRMRIKVPKPRRTFLETDELAALLSAAADQDRQLRARIDPSQLGPTTRLVAHLLEQGHRPSQVARRLGVTKSTIAWRSSKIGASVGRGYIGRHVICAILGYTGVRISELCELRIGQVRLRAQMGAYFHIPDSKTQAGVREVQISPHLADVITDHLHQLRRIGRPTGPDDFLVQSIAGGRISRQRAARVLRQAAQEATDRQLARGLSALPNTTPHTLRRTYISIALVANSFDVKWVQAQVGHADSQMTMDVYAQLEQRIDRSHGQNFDRLLHRAHERLDESSVPRAENVAVASEV